MECILYPSHTPPRLLCSLYAKDKWPLTTAFQLHPSPLHSSSTPHHCIPAPPQHTTDHRPPTPLPVPRGSLATVGSAALLQKPLLWRRPKEGRGGEGRGGEGRGGEGRGGEGRGGEGRGGEGRGGEGRGGEGRGGEGRGGEGRGGEGRGGEGRGGEGRGGEGRGGEGRGGNVIKIHKHTDHSVSYTHLPYSLL